MHKKVCFKTAINVGEIMFTYKLPPPFLGGKERGNTDFIFPVDPTALIPRLYSNLQLV